MVKLSFWTMLWPGLPSVRMSGSWKGLCVAIVFGWLLALAIWSCGGWSEWMPSRFRESLWWLLSVTWLLSLIGNRLVVRRTLVRWEALANEEDRYKESVTAYLSGQWARAESLLVERLQEQPQDAESRLLLGTLLRRRHREEEAKTEFLRLLRSDGGARWIWEVEREMNQFSETSKTGG